MKALNYNFSCFVC